MTELAQRRIADGPAQAEGPGLLARWRKALRAGGDSGRRRGPGRRWYVPRLSTVVALAILLLAVGLRLVQSPLSPWLELARNKAFDMYQVLHPRPTAGSQVTIVDIDEQSLAAYGQWPWSRVRIAQMIINLHNKGAQVIGMDVVFPEPDRLSPSVIADSLPQVDEETRKHLRELQGNDEILADVLRQTRVVLGRSGYARELRERLPPEQETPPAIKGVDPKPFLITFPTIIANLPELELAASGSGLFSLAAELDGIVRRVPLVARVGDRVYPALALEMLRVYTGQTTLVIDSDAAGVKQIIVPGAFALPTDANGRIWVHFAKHDPGLYLSAKDVLEDNFPPERVAGKLILLGTSAVGLFDKRSTPLDSSIPGVEVHANILDSVMSDTLLRTPNYANSVEALIILIGGLLLIVLVPRLGPLWTLLVLLAGGAATVGFSGYLFVAQKTLIDASYPGAVTVAIYAVLVFANYMRDEAEKQRVRGAFSRYMSPALVEQLAENPGQLRLGGEIRDMTILFSDIRGFTTISEQFDAEGLTGFMNRYLTPMTDTILGRRGTIDKYIGDAIMAFWNAPLDDPDHAVHACEAGLEMLVRLAALNRELQSEAEAEGRPFHPIRIGIGINTGPCCVGNMGSEQRFDYSLLGDAVNLASRLEGQTKAYGVDFIIGEDTRAAVSDFATLELDHIRVKGKQRPAYIHAVIGRSDVAESPEFQRLAAKHHGMMQAYRSADFAQARKHLESCRGLTNGFALDGVYDLYAQRIAHYLEAPPPPDWDGVFVATQK